MPTDFDARAGTWDDDPVTVHRARAVAEAVRASVPMGSSTRLLEYGAGTGLVSQALADNVGSITLADPSTGMRAVLFDKVTTGALPADTRIWELDLTADTAPDERFDLLITAMTLHHIHDLRPVLDGFAELLAHNGHLCVADLEQEDGSFHGDDSGFDGHFGFDRTALQQQLETAGFVDVRFGRCHEIEREDGVYPLFLATCTRQPS